MVVYRKTEMRSKESENNVRVEFNFVDDHAKKGGSVRAIWLYESVTES